MQLFVRDLNGSTSLVNAASNATVADVKAQAGLEAFNLVHSGRVLENATHCSLLSGCTLDVTCDLLGEGKKRKKKQHTTPKRIPHKHKTVKLATLKFYKIGSDGKVQRIKRECPNCPKGTFMAMHFDRFYCGKCTLTYLIEKK